MTAELITSSTLMDRATGLSISDIQDVRNSIVDILTTPLGSRVMRPTYGSDLFNLMDRPINRLLIAQLNYSVIVPVRLWEPRFQVGKVSASLIDFANGRLGLDFDGFYLIGGRVIPATLQDLSLDFFKTNTYGLNFGSNPTSLQP